MSEELDGSERLEEAKQQRRGLRSAMAELEGALAGAAPVGAAAWGNAVRTTVERLRAAVDRHIAVTEGADGLFGEIVERAPRLAPRVDRLRADHVELAEECSSLAARLDGAVDDDGVTQVRDAGVALLTHLVRHRHLGADLVYEAYNVDIDASD